MLNTPLGLQPCSSSPISARSGSAESVVFPVPESPKKTATRPSSPMFAEQCIGRTPSSGSPSFIRVKVPLLDFAGVEGPADQHLAARRVQHDECARARAVLVRRRLDLGGMQD